MLKKIGNQKQQRKQSNFTAKLIRIEIKNKNKI